MMKPPVDINQYKRNREPEPQPEIREITFPETDVKTLAIHFYGDVYLGAAERQCIGGQNRNVFICACNNRRVPGRYEFIPGYRFYIAKQSVIRDVYWNLGQDPDESVILERFTGRDAAGDSPYGEVLAELELNIEEAIRWNKDHPFDPFDIGGSLFSYSSDQGISLTYTVCEMPSRERNEFVQFYFIGKRLKHLSRSDVPLQDLMRFFPDFDTLDTNQLHLRTFLPAAENAVNEGGRYHDMYCEALDAIAFDIGEP